MSTVISPPGVTQAYVDAGDAASLAAALAAIAALPSAALLGGIYFNGDSSVQFPFGAVQDVGGSGGSYAINFISDLGDENYGYHITIEANGTSEIWVHNARLGARTSAAFAFTTKLFDPGILGVALPSWNASEPPWVTVTFYRI